MRKVIVLMMDSFGVGGANDAKRFDDEGANTFFHIQEKYKNLMIPNLEKLGLGEILEMASGKKASLGKGKSLMKFDAKYGYMREKSLGKDTISGHWEMAGVVVDKEFGHFDLEYPSFPEVLIEKICKRAEIEGILGNKAHSGTVIIQELGEEHLKTLKPIFYTSADSNLQIAAHEEKFGLERLYRLCEIAFEEVKPYNIARVIARPFIGEKEGEFVRTKNRKDYAVSPFGMTVLEKVKNKGMEVIGIGKIPDIYAHIGFTKEVKASGLEELWDKTLNEVKELKKDGIIFTNFVDFDMNWGHRRDVDGYAKGLEYFDKRLIEIEKVMGDDDICFITADHGCDPTFKGSDHTRECVPVIVFGKKIKKENLGERIGFSDIGQTIAEYLGVDGFDGAKGLLK